MYAFSEATAGPIVDNNGPPVLAGSAEWFAVIGGQQAGPFTDEDYPSQDRRGRDCARHADLAAWRHGLANRSELSSLRRLVRPHRRSHLPATFVVESGQQVGPVTLDDVIARIATGSLKATSDIWKDGLPAWVKAGELPELAAALASAPTATATATTSASSASATPLLRLRRSRRHRLLHRSPRRHLSLLLHRSPRRLPQEPTSRWGWAQRGDRRSDCGGATRHRR